MSPKSRILISTFGFLLAAGALVVYYFYHSVMASNVRIESDRILYIKSDSNFDDVVHTFDTSQILKNTKTFTRVAQWMNYGDSQIVPGKYTIKPGWNNRQVVSLLRSGNQTPVNLVINTVRTIQDLAAKIGTQVESDSNAFLNYLADPSLIQKYGVTPENILSLFIPNTYQVYWTIKPKDLVERMKQESEKFWAQDSRQDKANQINLSRTEVYTLASIVERETQAASERPTVAGLYLNRLKQSIPLQADPTVVFATGIYDLRRVLNKHLEMDSPYNTYKYAGLPPGPIFMPSIQSLDAVLNAENHDYLYMCARPDNSGLHAFAASLSAHNQNANRYRLWLNERGIK